MAFITVSGVVTKALSKVVDNSDELRAKFVVWFNEVARDIFTQPREWGFLSTEVTVPVVLNRIDMPTNASEIISLQVGGMFLTKEDQLSAESAFKGNTYAGLTPTGYLISTDGKIIFYPGAEGDCVLTYESTLNSDLADTTDPTIFPMDLESLFVTGLRMHYYDYDKDGRYSKEVSLYDFEMSKVKAWDNRNKPKPTTSPKGYLKGKR